MLSIVIVICLIGDPKKCEEHAMPVFEQMTPYQCAAKAQSEIAKFMETKPGWGVSKFGCVNNTSQSQDI